MSLLTAFDSDLLCALFANSTLYKALGTNKSLAAALAPLIKRIRSQQTLALAVRDDVFKMMVAIANKKQTENHLRVVEGVCHGIFFRIAKSSYRVDRMVTIEVYATRPIWEMSVHVRLSISDKSYMQFADASDIVIHPTSHDKGMLTIEYPYCYQRDIIPEVQVCYHRGYAAALRAFGIFI
jgi:hypothetical protein